MNDVHEISRHAAPGGRPHPLAFHDGTLWIGSRDASRLYGIDTKSWSVIEEAALPGEPFGLASHQGALHVVVSVGADDDRAFYRYVPGTGFASSQGVPCPESTGSALASDGSSLYLMQATFGKIVQLDAAGAIAREIEMPSRAAGIAFGPDGMYMIAADDEFDVLEFGALDFAGAKGAFTAKAGVSNEARGLAFDGKTWWTNLRELGETIAFSAPGRSR